MSEFLVGDVVTFVRDFDRQFTAGKHYIVQELVTGSDPNINRVYKFNRKDDLIYPMFINDVGSRQGSHPSYLTLVKCGSLDRLMDNGAAEYEEAIAAQELMK